MLMEMTSELDGNIGRLLNSCDTEERIEVLFLNLK